MQIFLFKEFKIANVYFKDCIKKYLTYLHNFEKFT